MRLFTSSSVKACTRQIMRVDELSLFVRLGRRTSQDSDCKVSRAFFDEAFMHLSMVSPNGEGGEASGIPTGFDVFPSNFGQLFDPGAKMSI